MRNRTCPKCESSNIYITQDDQLAEVRIGGYARLKMTAFISATRFPLKGTYASHSL